ncbi:DUF262 domain-containing protein [Acinetobacter schindleri]|uniref:DUF262 domain-containing protein n=1 Tax=Acinetobacter schindleri TaxID=108981 RepID=UPI003F55A2E7
MANITDAFTAESLSVYGFFSKNGQCLYVPAYQRQYAWGSREIENLLLDITDSYSKLLEDDESFGFLGSIITVKNENGENIYPLQKGHLPTSVKSIIDGQQRSTTLLITAIALHSFINNHFSKLISLENETFYSWINYKVHSCLGKLANIFEEDQKTPNKDFTYYPRLIRAFDDCWSGINPLYTSPIAYLIHDYGKFSRDIKGKTHYKLSERIKNSSLSTNASLLNKTKSVEIAFDTIFNIINEIVKKSTDRSNAPHDILTPPIFDEIKKHSSFIESLLGENFPEDLVHFLEISDSQNIYEAESQLIKELIILILFSTYFMNYVALTVVTAKNEDYAFNIFESLNTTGEPLTAFETFKPKVIKDLGVDDYYQDRDHIKSLISSIENYLEKDKNESSKKTLTTNLIISFATLWSGKKISSKLGSQRSFFNETYSKYSEYNPTSKKYYFIYNLYTLNEFIEKIWSGSCDNYNETYFKFNRKIPDIIKLSFNFLRDLKHTIVIAPLARFYQKFSYSNNLQNNSYSIDQYINDFEGAVKATVAFSLMWRSSRKGTDGIDNIYRKIFNVDGLKNFTLNDCIDNHFDDGDVSLSNYKEFLINQLKNNKKAPIISKEDWVDRVKNLPIYYEPNCITKFILLASSHGAFVDKSSINGNPIIRKSSKLGFKEYLTNEKWEDENIATVEHIVPQTLNKMASTTVSLDNKDDIHKLGNLTLLPQSKNSLVGNRSWIDKKLIFQYLIEVDPTKRDALELDLRKLDNPLTDSQIDKLSHSIYLPILESVANYHGEWSSAFINERSENIANLAYDEISHWLF